MNQSWAIRARNFLPRTHFARPNRTASVSVTGPDRARRGWRYLVHVGQVHVSAGGDT